MKPACTHKQATHRCGTHARYVLDQCRCNECREVNTAYERRRNLWNGEFPILPHPFVPADPSRRHVRKLMAQGMAWKRIAETAGVGYGTLWKLLWGKKVNGRQRRSRNVRCETEQKILTVELELAPGTRVDATEAWLIVDELVRRGWQKAEIARRITGRHEIALQLSKTECRAGTIATLRTLLTQPTPPQRTKHGPRQPPHTPPKTIPATTPGIPGNQNATLVTTCAICDTALSLHQLSESCESKLIHSGP